MKTIKLAAVAVLGLMIAGCGHKYEQPELGARKVQIIAEGDYQFKDLNKNGALDAYEDWRLPMEERIADLVSQMTLEEKAGLMLHPNIAVPESGEIKYDFTDEEKAYAQAEIDAFNADPIASEINSVVSKIYEGIGKKAKSEADAVVSEQNAANASVEDIFAEVSVDAPEAEDTNIF